MVIDTDNYQAAGIKTQAFPGGELHPVVPPPRRDHVHIFAKLRTWQDVGNYVMVCSAYRAMGVRVHTFMPYLPGARQDRVQSGFPLSADEYGHIIGGATDTLTAVDVHSKAAEDFYGNYTDLKVLGFEHLKWLFTNEEPYDAILAADAGGVERAHKMAAVLGVETVLECSKKRDSATGRISGFKVPNIQDDTHRNWRILIPDDICDGGGTFVGIVSAIKEQAYTPRFDLYVTHGIFSKGLDALFRPKGTTASIAKIFTTNSWTRELPSNRLQIVNLLPYYLESLTP